MEDVWAVLRENAEQQKEFRESMKELRESQKELPNVKLLGAIAAGIITPEALNYAHRKGFFVLELKGESIRRVPPPPDFKPKEWQ